LRKVIASSIFQIESPQLRKHQLHKERELDGSPSYKAVAATPPPPADARCSPRNLGLDLKDDGRAFLENKENFKPLSNAHYHLPQVIHHCLTYGVLYVLLTDHAYTIALIIEENSQGVANIKYDVGDRDNARWLTAFMLWKATRILQKEPEQ
jgi:hypothetical protein